MRDIPEDFDERHVSALRDLYERDQRGERLSPGQRTTLRTAIAEGLIPNATPTPLPGLPDEPNTALTDASMSELDVFRERLNMGSDFLSAEEQEKLRKDLGKIVSDHITSANAVLDGTKQWSGSQVTLYRSLLNKVIPDARATQRNEHVHSGEVEVSPEDLDNMTDEQLLEIIAANQPRVINAPEPKTRKRKTKKK